MKEHQALPVAGYTAQSSDKVERVNANKRAEEMLLRDLDALFHNPPFPIDVRWLEIARQHIEQGFMAYNRAIFMPGRVKLEGDDKPDPLGR